MFFKLGCKGTIYFFIHNGVKIFISPFLTIKLYPIYYISISYTKKLNLNLTIYNGFEKIITNYIDFLY